ncbi:MAG: methyltransferase domain-containing protein [Gammaproteobacteria bacterium]|nr:methyltransferase domain-containing protein [Gammaproteobacteria bacterium]MYH45830.1 methyltransferase domain-containing protein [Gammaproteobacteria bacterium]MYL12780.1 methyltransferase domain-containing protein [Gammaproteobacteria bacterium]
MTPAPDPVTPRCAVFEVCGGCSRQDIESGAQSREKQSTLQRHLRESAGIEPDTYELLPPVTGPQWNYRRKARLAVRMVRRKGRVLVGFREKRGNYVTVMEDCEVLAPGLAELIRPLRVLLDGLAARETIPQIEVAAGEAAEHRFRPEAALVLRHLRPLDPGDLHRLTEFAVRWNLQMYLQPGGVDGVHRIYPRHGPERLYYHLPEFGLRLAFHPMDFLQVNAAVNRRAVRLVTDLLALGPEDHVLDLFCGLGNFSLPIAGLCAGVTGIEGSADMVARAEENARANGLENTRFFTADLYRWNTETPWAAQAYTRVLLDPPRSGALETVPLIAAGGARKLVYVSCNPESLARDARELTRRGFHLKSAGVMDMFPHTLHIEAVALFERA